MTRTTFIPVSFALLALMGCNDAAPGAVDDGQDPTDTSLVGPSDGDPSDTDSSADSSDPASTDTEPASLPPLRIEAECAFSADAGDCNGAVEGGFNADLPGQDGAATIPLFKDDQNVVGYFFAGSWLAFPGIDLTGYTTVALQVASANGGGAFEIRIDAPDGTLLATIDVPNTGSWETFERVEASLVPVSGVHTVYLRSADNNTYNGDVDWLEFLAGTPVPPDSDTGTPDSDTTVPDSDTGTGWDGHKFVGNITTYGQVRSDFIQYWDQITPENEGKWGSVEGTRDVYNWRGVDAVYNYSREHGIPFKQHTFVWGAQYPSWIDSLSPTEQAEEIEEWISDFCTRYPDTELIDVVNEATPGHAPAGYARSAFGDDWIIDVFRLAKEHCPRAVLILNDYNVLSWNTNEFIAMATPAVNAGVVDAIGLQAHGLATWSTNDIRNKLNQVAALGLPLYISEYDADVADDQQQRNVMEAQFTLFYEHPQVKGITLWGYMVGGTWVDNSGLIRSDGSFRPAMTWLMDYLGR